jgi:hypothetical protein
VVGKKDFIGEAFHLIATALAIGFLCRRRMVDVIVSVTVVALCTWLHAVDFLLIGQRWSISQGSLANLELEPLIWECRQIRRVTFQYTVLQEDSYICYMLA